MVHIIRHTWVQWLSNSLTYFICTSYATKVLLFHSVFAEIYIRGRDWDVHICSVDGWLWSTYRSWWPLSRVNQQWSATGKRSYNVNRYMYVKRWLRCIGCKIESVSMVSVFYNDGCKGSIVGPYYWRDFGILSFARCWIQHLNDLKKSLYL